MTKTILSLNADRYAVIGSGQLAVWQGAATEAQSMDMNAIAKSPLCGAIVSLMSIEQISVCGSAVAQTFDVRLRLGNGQEKKIRCQGSDRAYIVAEIIAQNANLSHFTEKETYDFALMLLLSLVAVLSSLLVFNFGIPVFMESEEATNISVGMAIFCTLEAPLLLMLSVYCVWFLFKHSEWKQTWRR